MFKMMQQPVRAAGLIVFRRVKSEIQYLLMQHSYGARHWTPPKGHVDEGESDYQTALRETEEEAGLGIKVLRIITDFKVELNYKVTSYRDGQERPKVVTYWLAELLHPEVNTIKLSEEHSDYKWLTLDETLKLSGFSDQNEMFIKCNNFIEKNIVTN